MNHLGLSLQMVVDQAQTLPCAPALLPKLMEQLARPEVTAPQIEALIKLDAGLAVETLRLANSAYFHNAKPCDSLADAIVRLGFREIYRLATAKLVNRWLKYDTDCFGWEPGDLYRHSLTVAVAADLLCRKTGAANPEIAYTAGLLHDMGKLALAFSCGDGFDNIRSIQTQARCPWRVAERMLLGFDHTDVAGELVKAWSFPATLEQVVRFYPRPSLAAPEHRALVAHIHAAKHLALCLGAGVGEEGFTTELDEAVLKAEGLPPELVESMLPVVLEGSMNLLRGEQPA